MTKMNILYIFVPLEDINELLGVVIKQAKNHVEWLLKLNKNYNLVRCIFVVYISCTLGFAFNKGPLNSNINCIKKNQFCKLLS
jgi:hypothetical protein